MAELERSSSGAPANNRTPAKAKLPWHTRLMFGVAFWLAMAMGIPFYAKTAELRWAFLVLSIGVSAAIAIFIQPTGKREPKRRAPKITGAPGLVEELASKAIERADRAVVGWLTIVGAAHSAVFAVFASGDRFDFFTASGSTLGLLGAAFLVLGIVCYSAHYAITSTRQQANRALMVASKTEPAGAYFRFVYEDENKPPTMASMLVSVLSGIGYAWVAIGILLSVMGYLVEAILA
jgi:hypothetical protein